MVHLGFQIIPPGEASKISRDYSITRVWPPPYYQWQILIISKQKTTKHVICHPGGHQKLQSRQQKKEHHTANPGITREFLKKTPRSCHTWQQLVESLPPGDFTPWRQLLGRTCYAPEKKPINGVSWFP